MAMVLALAAALGACAGDGEQVGIGGEPPGAEDGAEGGRPAAQEPEEAGDLHGAPDGEPDRVVYGWYLGMPIHPTAIVPPAYGGDGPEAPSPDVPDLTVYLVAPVDEYSPAGPAVEIPGPDGDPAVLPPHQQTHDRLVDEDDPHDAIGVFVVPGPEATEETVRSAEPPENSVVGAPLASAVRMGAVWAPLSNHTAIEWGIQQGLLDTVPFEYGGLMWTTYVDDHRFDLACAPASAPPPREAPPAPGPPPAPEAATGPEGSDSGGRDEAPPPHDGGADGPNEFVVYGWYAGLPMRPTAILPATYGGPGPGAPSDAVSDVTVYLTAPVDDEAPAAPPREGIPTPDGPRNLPPHSQTHDRLVRSDDPHDAIGVFVVPGPEATEERVRWDEEPEDSAPGGPLASAVRVGEVWVGLGNHLAIEYGVAMGLLELVPFDYGGLMWHTFDDEGHWLACDG